MAHVEYTKSSFCNGIANGPCPECGGECFVYEAEHHTLSGPAKCQTGKKHSYVTCAHCRWQDTPDEELCLGDWVSASGY